MRTTNIILFLGTWERMYNRNFNSIEFDGFKNESGTNAFVMTPKKWISSTNAIGIVSKTGRYNSGTYAHPDIAFEFASWLSPEFKLYLITEFERLKQKEAIDNKIEWHATRLLSKVNYLIHTDAIKNNIVPILTEKQKKYVYDEEADLLNVALFGMTAKEWRESNTDLLHLIILNNLENINALLIKNGLSQEERLIILNETARNQMNMLKNNDSIKKLKLLEDKVNDSNLLQIDNEVRE